MLCTGIFTITIDGSTYHLLTVTDQLGKTVYEQPVHDPEKSIQLDLHTQVNGLYYLILSGSSGSLIRKLILAH